MWVKINEELVVALYNWKSTVQHGLSLVVGDVLRVVERNGDWYRGHPLRSASSSGVFPVVYVQQRTAIGSLSNRQNGEKSLAASIACEIACVLYEWSEHWKQLYILGQRELFVALWKLMAELLDCRRQLITGALSQDQLHELQVRVSAKIDCGNRQLGLDLVPRQNGVAVNLSGILLASLYDVHCQSLEMSRIISTCGTMRRRPPVENPNRQSVQVTLRDFGYSISDDVQLFFSLYDSVRCRYISERFLVNINGESRKDCESNRWIGTGSTIFTELSSLSSGLYLVIHAIRTGRMHVSVDSPRVSGNAQQQGQGQKKSRPGQGPRRFRRPFGVAVVDVGASLQQGGSEEGGEHEISVRLCQCDEREFHQLHQLLIRQASKYSVVGGEGSCGILLSLRALSGSAEQFQHERSISYLKQACISHKLGFPEIVMPGDFRNDLYLTLDRGEFERGGKSTAKNVEVGIVVVDSDGRHLSDGVVCGSGEPGSSMFRSVIIYHNNAPRWSDSVKLNVPLELFASVHVRLEFYHCSSHDSRLSKEKGDRKLFAFSFATLMNAEGSALKDGPHELCVYRCDDTHKLKKPSCYLHLPWNSEMVSANSATSGDFTRTSKEIVVISTLLCSTKLTQNMDLLSLLKWRQSSDNIRTTLNRVMKLDGEEIVKFLQDVLDSLFGMFSTDSGNSTPHSGVVFQVLVSIFVRLKESRFENFRPVLDTYVAQHFSAALIYKGLISCVRHYVDQAPVSDAMEPLVHGLRSLEFVFKFVVRSRVLFKQQSGVCDDADFCSEMVQLFAGFGQLLANDSPIVHAAQVALLQSIVSVFDLVRPLMDDSELTHHLAAMIDALPTDNLPVHLTKQKLATLRAVVASDLFKQSECGVLLLRFVCDQLCCHLCPHQQLSDTAQLLEDVLQHLFNTRSEVDHSARVTVLCTGVLDSLVRLILATESTPAFSSTLPRNRGASMEGGRKGGSIRPRLVCLLCSLLSLMSPEHYCRLWAQQTDVSQTARFLHRVIILFKEVLAEKLFPDDWFVLRMEMYRVLLAMMREFSVHLCATFVDKRHFNVQLLLNFMTLASRLATLPDLQLDTFSELKRQTILDTYGDIRVDISALLVNMWTHLGERKMAFVPALVGPLLEVSLVLQCDVRSTLLPLFYDMMCVEYNAKGCFKQVEVELVDKLDILISENKGDDAYLRLFDKIMTSAVKQGSDELAGDGCRFVCSVVRLLERLLDYRSVLEGDENRDKRMSCTVSLLEFYRDEIDRAEMYHRYIYKLHALHVEAGNGVEAALTLSLHADQLAWRSRVLHADHLYPVQSEWQRKEQLLLMVLEYLDRSQCWELGLPLLQQLIEQYESRLFDYDKLAETLRSKARFYQRIVQEARGVHEYFRVAFYGRAYPTFVRNKVFIYRGVEYERLASFIERIQEEFPNAKLMSKLDAPGDDVQNSDAQFVQICNVRPVPSHVPTSEQVEVPDRVLAFYRTNQVHTFQYDRPLPASGTERNTQFGHVWLERCTVRVSGQLPGILRWCPVVAAETCRVSPVQHGCETVSEATAQLRALTSECGSSESSSALGQLTMRLQGTIDAAVNGGLANLTTFFSPEYGGQFPDQLTHIQQLRTLINEQMSVLERALEVHGRLAAASLQPLHDRLCQCFSQLRRSVAVPTDGQLIRASSFGAGSGISHSSLLRLSVHHERKASIISTPLPPVPVESGRASVPASLSASECDSLYSTANETRGTGRLSAPLRVGSMCERPVSTTTSLSCSSLSSGHDSALSSGSSATYKQHHQQQQNIVEAVGGREKEGQPSHLQYRGRELDLEESEEQQSSEQHDYICIPHDSGNVMPPVRPPKQQMTPGVAASPSAAAAASKRAPNLSPLAPPLPPKPAEKRSSSVSLDLSQHSPQQSTPTHRKQWSVSSLGEVVGSPPPLPPKFPAVPSLGATEEDKTVVEPPPEPGSVLANYAILDCSNPRIFPAKSQQ